jgi:hypothetical protein
MTAMADFKRQIESYSKRTTATKGKLSDRKIMCGQGGLLFRPIIGKEGFLELREANKRARP